jgi:tetratricopeptide (TPR) repeat protein
MKNIDMSFMAGNFMLMQGHFDDARKAFLQYVEEAKNKPPDPSLAVALKDIGICFKKQGKLEEGLAYYKRALEVARKLSLQEEIADDISNMGVIYKNQGLRLLEEGDQAGFQVKLKAAEQCYLEAKEIDRKTNNTSGLASDLNNLGIVYRHLQERSKAIGAYEESKKIAEKLGEHVMIGKAEMNIGLIYLDSEKWDDCISYLQKALGSISKGGNDQAYSIALVKYNLGLAYFEKGNKRKSKENLQEAESLLKRMQIQDDVLSRNIKELIKKCK